MISSKKVWEEVENTKSKISSIEGQTLRGLIILDSNPTSSHFLILFATYLPLAKSFPILNITKEGFLFNLSTLSLNSSIFMSYSRT